MKPAGLRELTPRSVLVGLLVAGVMGAAYPYMVLKFGFGPNISVVSAFFGFIVLGLFSKSYNRWENNIVQTAGTSAGQIAFVCWLFAAFDMLAADPSSGFTVRLSSLQIFVWMSIAGLLGVLLAVPYRRHFVVDEKLPYPDGLAAGETLILLDSKDSSSRRAAFAMLGALGTSGLLMLATSRAWITDVVRIKVNRYSPVAGVGFALTLLGIGTGIIVGIRICCSMLIGTLTAWVIAPPLLGDAGIIPVAATRTQILLWSMWPAVGLMITGGLTSLALNWRAVARSFSAVRSAGTDAGDFPMRWVLAGSGVLIVLLALVQHEFIGTPYWQTAVAVALALPLMLVGLRVLGETNWGPVSIMTNFTQALFGALVPGNINAGAVPSGITASVTVESEGLMQDYKTGDMIGSTPRLLTYMQLLAVPVGALALALIYPLLRDTYGVGENGQLSSPTSVRWVGFAKILSHGFGSLPPGALAALAIGAALGVILALLETQQRLRSLVPSPAAVAIGMVIPASAVMTIFVGGLIEWLWRRHTPGHHARFAMATAAGLIAGDALVAVALPILYLFGVLSPP
jgi:uncharacterized oligopeptide transporter (OPT) family protein